MENLAAYDETTLRLKHEHEKRFVKAASNGWMLGTTALLFVTTYQLIVDPVPYETSIDMVKLYSAIGSFTLFFAHDVVLDRNYVKIRKIFFLLGFTALTATVGTFLVRDKPVAYHGVVASGSFLLVSMTLWFLSHSHAMLMARREANRPGI